MSKRWILLTVALLAVGTLVGAQALAARGGTAKAELGKAAPDFKLPDCYGKTFTLSEFKGKVVVLEWINQKCPISVGKTGAMRALWKKYASKGVIWLGIDSTDRRHGNYSGPDNNRAYAADKALAYPLLQDPDSKVGRAYDAKTTPHMFVIDKSGILVYDGAIDDQKNDGNYLDEALKAVLAGKKVARPKTKPYGCSVKYVR